MVDWCVTEIVYLHINVEQIDSEIVFSDYDGGLYNQ